MKLTYYVAECLTDSTCYSVRGKTKKSVVSQLKEQGLFCESGNSGAWYEVNESDEYKVPDKVVGDDDGPVEIVVRHITYAQYGKIKKMVIDGKPSFAQSESGYDKLENDAK